jgi:hypothetical protein
LGGQQIEIRDAAGTALCHAVLGSTPRPGTEALYETKLRLLAPDELDVFPRTVHFIGGGMECEHIAAAGAFTFRTLQLPECMITVKVNPAGDGITLDNIDVRIGAYTAQVDATGIACIAVPRGKFELSVLSAEIEPVSVPVSVTEDAMVEVQTIAKAVADEDAEREWM